MKYRKKPVEVEAEVYEKGMEDGIENWCAWYEAPLGQFSCKECGCFEWCKGKREVWERPYINNRDGSKRFISKGDYIITNHGGEKYPCDKNTFEASYEPA